MGEIDDWYKEAQDNLEDEFYTSLSKGADRKKVTENYRRKSDSLRKEFERRYQIEIYRQKKAIKNQKKKSIPKENFRHLEVEHIELEPNWSERQKRKMAYFIFKLKRRVKLTYYLILPDSWIYSVYSFNKKLKKNYSESKDFVFGIFNWIEEFFVKIGILVWNLLKKIGIFLVDFMKKSAIFLLTKIKNIFLKLKTIGKKKESVEPKPEAKAGETEESKEVLKDNPESGEKENKDGR